MASTRGVFSLMIGTWGVLPPLGHSSWEDEDPTDEVPALFVDGVDKPIWVAPYGTYWDQWGDGGEDIKDAIANALRDVLWPDHAQPVPSPGPAEEKRLEAALRAGRAALKGECEEHHVKWPCFTCVRDMEDVR